jgi:flagellar basal-body rod modification protein FlgD
MEVNGVSFKETTSATAGTSQGLAETFDTFLALLTTQLQNQDPLDPMDSSEFTDQLVQFAGVEQAINTNDKLDELLQLQNGSQLTSAVSYIGKTVEVVSDKLLLKDGASKITYGLDGNASQTTITILDEDGNTVRTVNGNTETGRHEFVWDGKDNTGNTVVDGVYNFTVIAVGSENKTIDTVTAAVGKVTGIEAVDGIVTLNIGELGATLDQIFAVRETAAQS